MPKPTNDDLSDKELKIATWLYYQRNNLKNLVKFLSLTFIAIIFFIAFINLVFYFLKFSDTRNYLKQATGFFIKESDVALLFAPNPLAVKNIYKMERLDQGTDFLVEIINPNTNWSAQNYQYSFNLNNQQKLSQTAFSLPGIHYLVVSLPGKFLNKRKPSLTFSNIDWYKINSVVDQERLNLLNFDILETKFKPGDKSQVVDTVLAKVKNNTPFGFWEINFLALVYQESNLVGLGQTRVENFAAGIGQNLEIGLGIIKPQKVDEIKIIPQVNILNQQSIMN